MSVVDTIQNLSKVIPVLGNVTGHPEIGSLAQKLLDIGTAEAARLAADSGKTTDEILQEASATWDSAIKNAEALRNS